MENALEQSVLAVIAGKPVTEAPQDLFIPPDALEVLLDSFSGPLDLLLYLIRRQNIDILNIPIHLITQQYMQYISYIKDQRLELAADYLVMAALLAEIKSRMLLPPEAVVEDEDEEDPRLALVRRLQAYEQFKLAAVLIDALPRVERDNFPVEIEVMSEMKEKIYPHVELSVLTEMMQTLMQREEQLVSHQISREPLSVRERMALILQRLHSDSFISFGSLLVPGEGRGGVIVTLLAILELSKQSLLVVIQTEVFASIYLQAIAHE